MGKRQRNRERAKNERKYPNEPRGAFILRTSPTARAMVNRGLDIRTRPGH